MTAEISPDEVRARVATSRRYRWVADVVVERLIAEEIPRSRNVADAEKRTKRRLHQIFGAYTGQADYTRALLEIATARAHGGDALRDACRAAMAQHASTRERLPILDTFYERIFAVTGVPAMLVDIACGLNPLALPWMGLPQGSRYVAYDIDQQLMDTVRGFLDLMEVAHRAELRDVVSDPPDDVCDVALLLKSIPCLDQQGSTVTLDVLRAIRARWVVVSFPTQSLGGRGKGMAETYRTRFAELLAALHWTSHEIALPGELVYVCEGQGATL